MIRVAHIAPYPHAVVCSYSNLRDRERFSSIIVGSNPAPDGAVASDLRFAGAPVYYGWAACWAAVRWADIIDFHTSGDQYDLYALIQSSGKPYVLTLHFNRVMPVLPAITVCTSLGSYEIQPDKERCVLIPNGIDLSRFKPETRPARQEVVITRICRPERCALYFWPAMQRILRQHPHVRLQIVGNDETGDNAVRSEGQVSFLGFRRDIDAILADTDIFVYTPYPDEGTKDLVIMEASAMGVPCIVADSPQVRESVWDGENGFVPPFGDAEAFVARIETLITDVALRRRMGRNAIRIAREHFDMAAGVRRLEAVFDGVLGAYRCADAVEEDESSELAALTTRVRRSMLKVREAQTAVTREAEELYNRMCLDAPPGDPAAPAESPIFLRPDVSLAFWGGPSLEISPASQELLGALQAHTGDNALSLLRKLHKEAEHRSHQDRVMGIERGLLQYAEELGIR